MEPSDFKIAIITALPIEFSCAEGMLDERYEDLPQSYHDKNSYTYGRIGRHNVVLACLPSGMLGTVSASAVAARVSNSFTSLRFGLLVGIGGGVPDMETSQDNDIRLGDIVVSKPDLSFGGVVQYRMGKVVTENTASSEVDNNNGYEGTFIRTGILMPPPGELLTSLSRLQARHFREDSHVPRYLSEMLEKYPKMKPFCSYQGAENDLLFEATCVHATNYKSCEGCDASRLVPRPPRSASTPVVHYGTIASDDEVMRNGKMRDKIAKELNALCFEMEAAGLMNNFPCLVIRGICDYADSHKNKRWQPYAAAVAAAYAKELLYFIPYEQIDKISTAPLSQTLSESQTASTRSVEQGYTSYAQYLAKNKSTRHQISKVTEKDSDNPSPAIANMSASNADALLPSRKSAGDGNRSTGRPKSLRTGAILGLLT